MEKIKIYTHDEMLDKVIGLKGTESRDEYDEEMEDFLIGLAIKRAREAKKLTQAQLGEKIGVQRARICSIEKGTNLRLSTLRKIFKALGLEVDLDIKNMAVVPIC